MNRRKFFRNILPAILLPSAVKAVKPEPGKAEPAYRIKLQVVGSVAEVTIEGSNLQGKELEAVECMLRRARRQIRDNVYMIHSTEIAIEKEIKR